jgi:hydroxymethylbilane synthase
VVEMLRGNLDTRLRKLDEGKYDAIIVAAAGLARLGLSGRVTEFFGTEYMLPAIGQGSLGIECRQDDARVNSLVLFLNHPASRSCVLAERALLRRLEGGCQVPIGAHATVKNGMLSIRGMVWSVDGAREVALGAQGAEADAEKLGDELARKLLKMGAGEILKEVYK